MNESQIAINRTLDETPTQPAADRAIARRAIRAIPAHHRPYDINSMQ